MQPLVDMGQGLADLGGSSWVAASGLQGCIAADSVLLNLMSSGAFAFANETVFSVYSFNFPYALTFMHSAAIATGMMIFTTREEFQFKELAGAETAPLAFAFVGDVVFWGCSLKLNIVRFYQLIIFLVTPAVIVMALCQKDYPTASSAVAEICTFVMICLGLALSIVNDPHSPPTPRESASVP